MKVQFVTTLNDQDAKLLGLEEAAEGQVLELPEKEAEKALERGWASELGPSKLKAVPERKVKAVPE